MKKKKIAIFVFVLMAFIALIAIGIFVHSDISASNIGKEKLVTIVIPESYFEYAGSDAAKAAESCIELGDEYCTSAEAKDNDLVLKVTDRQRENLIKRNNEFIDELLTSFKRFNSEYEFTGSEDYSEVTFYYDEDITTILQIESVFGVTVGYGLNSILQNNSETWSVHLKIVNCHTGKTVVEGDIPQDIMTYGPDEWKNSYE